ncbi:MAG: exopolysaccharide biosynthesis protein [Firmicutes bacterium]|nr:exopolysaccharide biosynthesis protein [Bacillota bacterium]
MRLPLKGQHRPKSPFFEELHRLLEEDGDVSLGELMASAGEQTYGLLILVSGLTSFIPAVSVAGGLVAMILGLQMAWGVPHPWLPKRLETVQLHRGRIQEALARFERWLLKMGPGRAKGRILGRRLLGVVIAWTAFLLALPVPPIIPLGNALPAAALCLQGAALLEERPSWVWLGLAGMVATTLYLGFSLRLIVHYLWKLVA